MKLHIYQNKIILISNQISLPGEVNFLGGVEKFSQASREVFMGEGRCHRTCTACYHAPKRSLPVTIQGVLDTHPAFSFKMGL